MEINQAINICLKKGIKVYPEFIKPYWRVAVKNKGKIKISDKPHTSKTINQALTNTYIFLAKKLK